MVSRTTRFAPTWSIAKAKRMKQALQVVFPCFLNCAAIDEDIVECDFLALNESRQIEPNRLEVLDQVIFSFLKRHEHAGLFVLRCATDQKLHAEHGLAATGVATNQGGTPLRQSTPCYFIQSFYSGRTLWQRSKGVLWAFFFLVMASTTPPYIELDCWFMPDRPWGKVSEPNY